MNTSNIDSGANVIRAALTARAFKGHLGPIARDLGIGVGALEAFVRDGAKLAPDTLKALARELYHGHVEYDVALDKLRSANKSEPTPLGIAPEPAKPGPRWQAGPHLGIRPVKPEPPKPKRPGWVE